MNTHTLSVPLVPPRGLVFTHPMYELFPTNVLVRAADSGVVSVDPTVSDDDGDPLGGKCIPVVSTLECRENRDPHDPLVFTRHLAATDRDGRLWQRSVPYSVRDLWDMLAADPWVQPLLQPDDLKARQPHLLAVEQRWLLPLQSTLIDDRDDLHLTVWDGGAAGKSDDRGETRVFRLRLKYFGSEFGIVERVLTYQPLASRPAGSPPTRIVTTHLVFQPHVDAQSYPDAAGQRADLLRSGGSSGPIFETRALYLRGSWTMSSIEPARLADRSAWETALRAAGVTDPATFAALRPNAALRYEQLEESAARKE